MSVGFSRCDHAFSKNPLKWRDSAGYLWVDEECKKCGRIWRNRVIGFGRRVRSDWKPAA